MHYDSRKAWLSLGHTVRELRTKAGISQLVLAERAELSLTYISQIERGRHGVSIDSLLKLARAFGLTGADLLRRAGL